MRLGNYRIREHGTKKSLFQKVEEIKEQLKPIIGEIEGHKLITIMSHVRNHYYGKLYYGRRDSPNRKPRALTQIERLVYDYLLKNSLNPSTTYRWFIATRLPQDVINQLQKGELSQKKAMQISANRMRVKNSRKGLEILEEIRLIVGGL
jgi:hypothetical protein